MKFLTFIFCLLLVGCMTLPPAHPHFNKMSQGEVCAFLFYTNQLLTSSHWAVTSVKPYAIPTSRWVEDTFTPNFMTYLFNNDLNSWIAGENDCVKFTTHGISEAYTTYHNDPHKLKETCLAVGYFDYYYNLADGHEIMFFIINDNNGKGYQLRFYEPQAHRFIKLTPNELLSCYNWRI